MNSAADEDFGVRGQDFGHVEPDLIVGRAEGTGSKLVIGPDTPIHTLPLVHPDSYASGSKIHADAAALAAGTVGLTQSLATAVSDPLLAIDWGTKVPETVIQVYFTPAGVYLDEAPDLGTSAGFTAYEKRQFFSALEQFEKVTSLQFVETTSQALAEFRVGTFQLDQYGAVAFMIPPGDSFAGLMAFDPDYMRWIDADSGNPLLSRGGFMYAILLEEFGHGLGLAHPHDEGGTSTILEGVDAARGSYGVGDLNQGVYTIMGYNEGWPAGPYGEEYFDGTYIYVNDFGYEAGPMALDIAVLQRKYGANLSQGAGNDVYFLPSANAFGTFFESIWDTGGVDEIRAAAFIDATIDLRPATLLGDVGGGGYVSYMKGIRGGFTVAAGVMIENATGGSGNDTLNGNAAANVLRGEDGTDRIWGFAGNDLLQGGAGDDKLGGDAFDALFDPVAARVYRLYRATLDREPDQLGHFNWTEQLLAGTSQVVVASGFMNSSEFLSIYGITTNEEFVTLLYNNVLGRDPDPIGLEGWTDLLDSGDKTRPEVVLGFSNSTEFVLATEAEALVFSRAGHQALWTDDVFRLYAAALDREPDKGGLLGWTGQLSYGLELTTAAAGFVNSPEFLNTYGDTTNGEFVTLLYNNVLDRDPDPVGFDSWTSQLDSAALTRAEVLLGFSQSLEFRIATAAGLQNWVTGLGENDRLDGGAGRNILFGGILADSFVFAQSDAGSHKVAGFEPWDWIELTGFGYASGAEARSQLVQTGEDVLFADQGTTISFTNKLVSDFTDDMFVLA